MAIYKHAKYLQQSDEEAFDKEYGPGTAVPLSGIYRCMGCGREVASNQGDPLPLRTTISTVRLRERFAGV